MHHAQDLGETLSGSRKINTPYEINFLDNVEWRELCLEKVYAADVSYTVLHIYTCILPILFTKINTFTVLYYGYILLQMKQFKSAIEADYFFEMYIDDLPMWGYVGEVCTIYCITTMQLLILNNFILYIHTYY